MALIKPYKEFHPGFGPEVFLAENATIIGEVRIGAQSSVWYQAVLRGDVGAILIGERSNIQDAAILHCTTGGTPTIVGNDVVVGHRAVLHGCTIEDEVLVGMGAIILDGAVVQKHCIVAAGALVSEGKILESGFLYAGVPAKQIKKISPEQIEMIRYGASAYVEKAKEYLKSR